MSFDMAKLNIDLPPHCQVKDRGAYADVYFLPKAKYRPEGWPACISVGRTDKLSPLALLHKAEDIYNSFVKARTGMASAYPSGSLPDLTKRFEKSEFWDVLSKRTQKEYGYYFKDITAWSSKNAHPHVKHLTSQALAKYLSQFKDTPIKRKRLLITFRQILKVAVIDGLTPTNVAAEINLPRSNKEKRQKVIWTQADIDRFVTECDRLGMPSLGSIALTMIETAQRRGDVIAMRTGTNYKDGKLFYVQSKTGAKVDFNATQKLKDRFTAYPPGDFMMFICEATGRPWEGSNVAHKAREVLDSLGMKDHILKDLRASQMTYLFDLGFDSETVASISGHSLETCRNMADGHYVETRSRERANKAIAKLDKIRAKADKKGRQGGRQNV